MTRNKLGKGMTLRTVYTEQKAQLTNTATNMDEGHDNDEFSKKLFAGVVKTKEFKNNKEASVYFNCRQPGQSV